MQGQKQHDEVPDIREQLEDIVNRMLEPFGKTWSPKRRTLLQMNDPPFDVSKPKEHDSKAEFLAELTAVESCLENIDALMGTLLAREGDEGHNAMLERLRPTIDQKARQKVSRQPSNNLHDMIRKNVADVGAYHISLLIVIDFWRSLRDRQQELKAQEERFWQASHRPPNHYARTIALRLAKLFARETGKKPTYGTSGETGDPSTAYSRALADTFNVLGIQSRVRTPAEWAIDQITDDDLLPHSPGLLPHSLAYRAHDRESSDQRFPAPDSMRF